MVALVAALFSSCGADLTVRGCDVHVEGGAQPWPDLPEALDFMLEAHPVDITIVIHPAWRGDPGVACFYLPSEKEINVRLTGRTTADGCLPHELAHALRHKESLAASLRHDAAWKKAEREYRDLAFQTWCHKNPSACE